MISLITQIIEDEKPWYYFVRAINLDTKNLKNSAWKLYILIKLFKHDLFLYLLASEKEQLYLRLPDNKKETLLQALTDNRVESFTSALKVEEWKKISIATITIKFL